jgi:hypothetical protein
MKYKTKSVTIADLLDPMACWILGAGASYDCDSSNELMLPLTCDMMPPDLVKERLSEELTRFIENGLLPGSTVQEALGHRIENTIDCIRGLCFDQNPTVVEAATYCLETIVSVIADNLSLWQVVVAKGTGKGFGAENYLWLSSHVCSNPSLSLITLNYDELLDTTFRIARHWDLANPIQYGAWENAVTAFIEKRVPLQEESGVFVKLHGTLRLYSCHNPCCSMYREPVEVRKPNELEIIGIVPGGEPHEKCINCAKSLHELILPPGHNKTQGEGAYFDFVYSKATQALANASVWIALGYSFPDYDLDMRELMSNALELRNTTSSDRHRMLIFDPNALAIGERLTAAFGPLLEPVCIKETFSGLVKKITNS